VSLGVRSVSSRVSTGIIDGLESEIERVDEEITVIVTGREPSAPLGML
jgi:hypothetical protein